MEKIFASATLWLIMVLGQAGSVDIEGMIKTLGLPTALVVVLLAGWWIKDKRATQRHELLEDFVRTELLNIATNDVAAKKEVASSLRGVASVLESCPGNAAARAEVVTPKGGNPAMGGSRA